MSLFINQGKQDTSDDKSFEVMISAHEVAQIIEMKMNKDFPETLDVTFKVISDGKYKGRLFWDKISYGASSPMSWKYRNLRKAAGVPYTEGENFQIDIEALLLNKAVNVELNIRKGKDGGEYQGVKYIASKATQAKPIQEVNVETEVKEDDNDYTVSADEDLPW